MGGGPAKDHLLIVLPGDEPKEEIANLRRKFPHIDIEFHRPSGTVAFGSQPSRDIPTSLWKDVTILCTFFNLPNKASDAPKLDWVHLPSAGSNHIEDTWVYKEHDITITTSSGIHGPQIAEWVVMTALVQSHKYNLLHDLQKERKWGSHDAYGSVRDRVGLRLGVLGYGSIGRQVGRVARAMGMEVLAYTATPKDTDEKKKDGGFIVPGTGDPDGSIPSEWYSGLDKKSLHRFLEQDLDWLVVSVPLTKQTKHFLSTEEFNILGSKGKEGKCFITNIARGPIIDQPAFIEALKNGTLGGAALDVTDPEPLPSDSELWGLPNVTVTPHVSGVGQSYMERVFQVLATNLERREKGEKLINVVNRKRGY